MTTLMSQDFSSQCDELEKSLSDLYHNMLRAARAINSEGSLPDLSLDEEISAVRQKLDALRTPMSAWACSLGIERDSEELASLPALRQLLGEIAKREGQNEAVRLRALGILDRVLSLSHKNKAQFPALDECQAKASQSRRQLAVSENPSLTAEAARLVEGDHAFSALLALVDGSPSASEERLFELEEMVEAEFGKMLRFAATHDLLVERVTTSPSTQVSPTLVEIPSTEPPPPMASIPETEAEPPPRLSVETPPLDPLAPSPQAEAPQLAPSPQAEAPPEVKQEPMTKARELMVEPELRHESKTQPAISPTGEDEKIDVAATPPPALDEAFQSALNMNELFPELVEEVSERVDADERLPAQLLYQFHREDSVQRAAASILEHGDAAADPAGVRDLVWRLIYEDQLDAAFHLTRALEARFPNLNPQLTPSLIRALALSRGVRYADGEAASKLREDLAWVDQCFATEGIDGAYDWNLAVTFLLIAAALRPMMLVPNLWITDAQRLRHLPEGFPHLFACCQAVIRFSGFGQALNPLLVKRKASGDWREELEKLKQRAESWMAVAPRLNLINGQAKGVWLKWVGVGGMIHSLLQPVIENNRRRLPETRKLAIELLDEANVRTRVDQTNKQNRGGAATKIISNAFEKLCHHTREAAELALAWCDLQESDPAIHHSSSPPEAVRLQDEISKHLSGALAELTSFDSRPYTPYVMCGLAACRQAVENISQLFKPDAPLPSDEPDPKELLNAVLLRAPNIPMDELWEPEGVQPATLIRGLVELAAKGRVNWRQTFEARQERGDHEATLRLIEYLAAHPDPEINLAELREARNADLRQRQEKLRQDAQSLRREIDALVEQGWLREAEQVRYTALADFMDLALSQALRFFELNDKLKLARARLEKQAARAQDELESRRQQQVARVRQKIAQERNRIADGAYERIVALLDQGDASTAYEYLDFALKGYPLPAASGSMKEFGGFFPEVLQEILEALRYHASQPPEQLPEIALRFLRVKPPLAALLSEENQSRQQATEILKLWFMAKKQKKLSEDSLSRILGHFGFDSPNPTKVRSAAATSARTWFEVIAATLKEKSCPVSAYGSGASGRYEALCLWDNETEGDLINIISQAKLDAPPIVFYFGRLTVVQRRRLARMCIEKRLTFIVIDDALAFYLCHLPSPRLTALFNCTLPFTYFEPYNPDARPNPPPEMFYGRQFECEQILASTGSCFIYGGRRFGKTSLLHHAKERFDQWDEKGQWRTHAVLMDLNATGIGIARPADELWEALAEKLNEAEIVKVRANSGPKLLLEEIKKWLNADDDRRLLVLLDEADAFLKLDGSEDFPRTHLLKGLMDVTNNRFKVVFCGLNNVLRSTRSENHPLAHFGQPLCIGPLLSVEDRSEARNLIERPLVSLGYKLSADLITQILSQTGYYPNLIQLYCQQLLRYVNSSVVSVFDVADSPPYTVTSRHSQETYQNRDLQKRIRDYFLLTLDLDKRYLVIAHIIALESIPASARIEEPFFSVTWIRDQALTWWPEGFKDSSSPHEMGVLLEEMVELGVLREDRKWDEDDQPALEMRYAPSETRYALRSPNMALLLGSQEEIEATLLESPKLEPPPKFDSYIFRSTYVNDDPHRSPLTMQQAHELRERRNGVSIIFGCRASDSEELKPYLEDLFKPKFFFYLNERTEQKDFLSQLDKLNQRAEGGTTLVLVAAGCPWDENWVQEAHAKVSGFSSKSQFARVAFIADPQKTWQWLGFEARLAEDVRAAEARAAEARAAEEVSLAETCLKEVRLAEEIFNSVATLSLTTWHDGVVRQWMEDFGLRITPDERKEVTAMTGNWPILLRRFYDRVKSGARTGTQGWKQHFEDLDRAFDDSQQAEQLEIALGLYLPAPQTVLRYLVRCEPASIEELAYLVSTEEEISEADVQRSMKWAERLGLVIPVAVGNELKWQADPLAHRLLSREKE